MCQFFSFVTDIKGNKYYFNQEQRSTICKEEDYTPDSHTSIAEFYGFKGKDEDSLNKYEYDPFDKILKEDTITFYEDFDKVEEWCLSLDFNQIDKLHYELRNTLNEWRKNIGREVKLTKPLGDDGRYNCAHEVKNQIGTISEASIDSEYNSIMVGVRFSDWHGGIFNADLTELEFV